MRIGILINKISLLENWELRIVEGIRNDPDLELVLLIKDGGITDKKENICRIDQCQFKNIWEFLSKTLFFKQVQFEKKRYIKDTKIANKGKIIEYLNTIPSLKVKPKNKGNSDMFNSEVYPSIKRYKLDIILKHGFDYIKGEILNSAKYGVWYIYHSSPKLKVNGPPGFVELLNKEPVVGVILLQLSNEFNKGLVIDKAFFNRHNHSFVETNIKTIESSVSLLMKNIRKYINTIDPLRLESEVKYGEFSKFPKLTDTLKYLFNYYKNMFMGLLNRATFLFGKRTQQWSIFFGEGNFLESELSKLEPVEISKNVFWADPFLFKHQEQYYVFFENYSYKTKKGKISCAKIKDNKLIDITDVLDFDYHLSFPFIFEEDDEIYLMPETAENKRLEIYKCLNFPSEWELYSTAFEGENITDAFFYNDKNKQKWLFLNKVVSPNMDRTSELYIYKVDSLRFNKIESHKQNPVIIDARVARNGGGIFEYQNNIYRSSQSNTDGVYGKSLNINQIEELTITNYREKIVKKIEPNFRKDLVSIHHMNQIDGMFVFDAALNTHLDHINN